LKTLGKALAVEFYDCNREILNDVHLVEQLLKEAALAAKATIVESVFHTFNPHGISGVVVIAESHLAIHTWPEYGYAAIDIFTCGPTIDPWIACYYLKEKFQAGHYEAREIRRGYLNTIRKHSSKQNLLMPEYITHKPMEKVAV
jgi:S-adenosylmethionine decarboxylase proenzyme